MSDDERLIAFAHGALGDESCDHLVVPKHMNLSLMLKRYYAADPRMPFVVWLKEHFGARDPRPDELEVVDE